MRRLISSAALALLVGLRGVAADPEPAATVELRAGAAIPASPMPRPVAAQPGGSPAGRKLEVLVGKSVIVDSPLNIQRISVANGELAEAVAVNPKEVLINGKLPGETTVVLWQQGGARIVYDLVVRQSSARIETARKQIADDLPGQDVNVTVSNDSVFLHGTVNDLVSAERAVAIASTLGKVVDLLHVKVPPVEAQILLKVKFANVDRAASTDLGVNIVSTGALNTPGAISTGQFSPSRVDIQNGKGAFTLGDALNVFLFRPDLNLAATIKALQSRRLLEILAEPNVLAINGKQAAFVAGGEFPFPTLQGGGAGLGSVTIQFREFGVRINFLPNVTPRGSIRLQVMPEVSSLDFANGLVFQGFNIPALATRRVQTEVELEDGQTFAIAGLLDNRLTETLEKIPGIGDIPLLGKLFHSKSVSRNNTELLVMITPELVRPIPAGQPPPDIQFPKEFLQGVRTDPPQTPGMKVTGKVPMTPPETTIPVEQLRQIQLKQGGGAPAQAAPGPVQFVPVPVTPSTTPQANPGLQPTTPLPQGGSPGR